jgi:RIO-like serine/threonine protein kinase
VRRNDDLIRAILFEMEASPDPYLIVPPPMLSMPPGMAERYHHVQLLADAGLVARDTGAAYRLTNQGHDFLAAIRDDGLWQRTKRAVAETGGNATLSIIVDLAKGFLRKQISERTGIDL